MIPYPLSRIDAAVFQEICEQRTSESSTLDFKQTLPGKEDKDKEELAKDVSALLNADGGDLVYGIGEDRTTGTAKAVVPLTIENFDKEERRILQILDAWIEPRFHGIQFHQVPLEGGCGIVLRVPMSFDGPHWVRNPAGNYRRFVIRNGKMTSDMSLDQVRSAFTASASLAAQARDFINGRLNLIRERKMHMPMGSVPIAAFELVSLSGIARRKTIDIKKIEFVDFIAWRGGANPKVNIDGLGAYLGDENQVYAYSQLFRNGAMEFVKAAGGIGMNGAMGIWGEDTFSFFENSLEIAISAAKKYDITGPALIQCALMHVYGIPLEHGGRSSFRYASDRHFMVFPEIYIEDLSGTIDINEALSDTRDVLYQAFGMKAAPPRI